jgi:hypothetical protein
MKESFLFISTNNSTLVQKVKELGRPPLLVNEFNSNQKDNSSLLLYSSMHDGIIKHSFINSRNDSDYSIHDFKLSINNNNWLDQHELHSFVFLADEEIIISSDPLGVFTAYYYQLDETAILSDNIFLIANILNVPVSIESLFDSVLFKKPYGKNTWFEGIYCLQAGETAIFNLKEKTLKISGGTNLEELLYPNQKDFIYAFSSFFDEYASNVTSPIVLSLSPGSDSGTILAGLLNKKVKFLSASWGGADYFETRRIQRLVKKNNLEWKLIEFTLLKEKYYHYHIKSLFDSNGLMPAPHLYFFKSQMPSYSWVFEGFGGSEFIKGELSDGMFTPLQYKIIVKSKSLEGALQVLYGDLPESILNLMREYYETHYSEYFEPINCKTGSRMFLEYLFKTLPPKIFGGIFCTTKKFDLQLYEPYLSPHILSSVFSNKLGVVFNHSLSPHFSGGVRNLKPQSLFLKHINSPLYYTVLDRNVKFSEWNDSLFTTYLKSRIRSQIFKFRYRDSKVLDQVDYNGIRKSLTFKNPNIQSVFPDYDFGDQKNAFGLGGFFEIIDKCRRTEVIKEYFYEHN